MRHFVTFVVLLVLAAGTIWYSLSPQHPVAKGLDLQGGMRVTLEPDPSKMEAGTVVTVKDMERVRDVLENRVNSFGLSGADVRIKNTVDNKQQVLVTLPGVQDPQEALRRLTTVAQLEFRHLQDVQTTRNPSGRYKMDIVPGNPERGEPESYTFVDTDTNKPVPQEEVLKDAPIIVRGGDLLPTSKPEINPQNGQPYITFEFNSTGAKVFGDFTSNNVGEILAVVLDKKIISAPNINEPITGGKGQISGGFATMVEARLLSNLLNSGALPIALKPAETQQVGATLGQESINKSIHAGVIGLGLVLAFMLLYYWLPGFLACIALIFYASLTFSIFKGIPGFLPPIVLDLPGITGFILSVGMAVDANILIFERLKEELRAGKSMHAAIDAGFSRAFSSILDSNVTTWIVCAVLVWLGAPIIRGFAITLAIGVAVSMFTAITVTRTLLHVVTYMDWARNPALYGVNVGWLNLFFPAHRQGGILHVWAKRRIYLGFSIVTSILALIFIAMTPFGHGLRPGIDFTGGSVVEAAFRTPGVTEAREAELRGEVTRVLAESGIQDATVSIGRSEQPFTKVSLEATDVDESTKTQVRDRLQGLATAGFDPNSYKPTSDAKTFKAEGLFTSPVTENQIREALAGLTLKGLKVTAAPEPHTGREAAIPVALIQSRRLLPAELQDLKTKLAGVGGGIVLPMYQESSIGPSVAKEVTLNAFSSVAVASLGIILYLSFRFAIGGFMNGLKFGVSAVIALIHDVGIVIGIFALMGALRGWQVDSLFVTAALTVLGFSVHDTIVVYDRIRENLRHRGKGESFADVSDRSITQTFDRSINTSMTVLLVVAALVFFGGESIKLFNVALLIGVAIGTYSSIFVASPLVVLWERASAARAGQLPAAPPARPATPARPRPEPSRPAAATSAGTVAEGAAEGDSGRVKPGSSGRVAPRKKRRL